MTPPKSVFFDNRAGTLLVHASLDDLDTIEQAVGALSTKAATTTQPATPRISVQADRPGPATVRRYTNEQLIGEQKFDLSPGKNLFNFPSNSVPPATNQAKLPVLGDLPVVGSVFQVRTAQVAAANSPQQMTNAANAGTGEKLLTRIIKVDPNTFGESVRKTAGLLDSSTSQDIMDTFRKLVLSSGVELRPPANMFYSERAGSLFVRATAPEMEVIEQVVGQLNIAPAQINIKARFVEVSEDDTKAISTAPDFISVNADTNSSTLAILTDPQFRVILHALEIRDGVEVVGEQNVTTLSGRQAQIQIADLQTIVKLNPQALVPPGASNAFVTETLSSGPLLDVIPYVAEGGDKIQLNITAKVTEFLGYDPPPENSEAVPVYVDGQATTIKQPHPQTHVRTMQAAVNLYDGQTVMLGRPKDEMITFDKDGKALSTPSTSKRNLLVFVTATVIDAAGNPVHNPAGSSATPGHN
jgi:type II secretory pathway component GspD/PulD (secretin)